MDLSRKTNLEVADRCSKCNLKLLSGAFFDALAKTEIYGPILRLGHVGDPEEAEAGYVGISSYFDPVGMRELYRCPRCGTDAIIEVEEPDPWENLEPESEIEDFALENFSWSVCTEVVLKKFNIKTVGELLERQKELSKAQQFSERVFEELNDILRLKGLSLDKE